MLLPVGIAIAVCVLAYSAGPFPLAYNGLGDICVLLFYGIVPVVFTYFVQAGSITLLTLILSVAMGLLSVNILIVNNYRDYFQDKEVNKRTTIVLFGRRFGRWFYLFNGVVPILLVIPLIMQSAAWIVALFGIFFVMFYQTWREICSLEGKALNVTLAYTGRNVLLFALCLTALLLF